GHVTGVQTCALPIFGNLLANAAKFTDPGGVVSVRLEVDRAARRVAVTVHDTGVGFEPGAAPHLFEPFTQADRTLDRSRGGLGLGLALVKGLVELHGGRVSAHSAGPGCGAEFTFRLPLADEPGRAGGPAVNPASAD